MAFVPERHVAIVVFPFASHPPSILNLTRRLASATPKVVYSFFNTSESNKALFHNKNWHNIRPYDVSDGLPEGFVSSVAAPGEHINLFLDVAEKELRRVVKVAEADIGLNISCLMGDAFLWLCNDIADEMNIPWVAFWSGLTCTLTAHFYSDLITQKYFDLKGSSAGTDDEIVDLIPGLPAVRLDDLPREVFEDLEMKFLAMLHNMGRTLGKATAVCINSFEEQDPGITKDLSSKFNYFLNVGPFNLISKQQPPQSKVDEHSCISFLDSQKSRSVAYISFGTVCKPPPVELVALVEALDETKTPFLWSIDDDSKMQLPQGFLERRSANGTGKTVPWAPQTQVLEHFAVGVFITHGGANSILESVVAGVPMICRPFYGDQPMNSWMVEKVWGVGVRIQGGSFTKHETRSALEQVLLSDKSSKRIKERNEELKDLAHKAVGPNGSSTRNFNTLVDIITR